MEIFILSFRSPHYPEDNRIIGAYKTEEAAKRMIASAIASDKHMHPNHPQRYQQSELYYDIQPTELED
jgi:hypothetical protein